MQRKKMLIAVLAIALLVGIVSAATISYFGQVNMTATVKQAVLLDGKDYTTMPITETADVAGGESFCRPHWLTSQTSVSVQLQFETSVLPTLTSNEITVRYLKPLGYKFTGTIGAQPVSINVVDGSNKVTWTIDFPLETPYVPETEGNGLMAVGLIIALDGEGKGPAFQIHNNDGTDSDFAWGTWLVSPWGPTITDGWFGWHSSNINTPVSELDWVNCTGERYNENNPNGTFTIAIDKSVLCEDFRWALYTAIGSGFYSSYLTYQQATYPATFNWGSPIVGTLNYQHALLMTELPSSVTLAPHESLDFYICYEFAVDVYPYAYTITTTVKPA